MNAGALVYCILDADGEYTPDGYELIDTAVAGDYELRLWKGHQHVQGTPVKFYELSLNAAGRSFDPKSQGTRYTGSVHALGHRRELFAVVGRWLKQFKEFYVGSYELSKVKLYHRLFKHYFPQLTIGDPAPVFDECEGQPDYFRVTASDAVLRQLAEALEDEVNVDQYVSDLPSALDRAITWAKQEITRQIEGERPTDTDDDEVVIDPDNLYDALAAVVKQAMEMFHLDDDTVDANRTFSTIHYHLVKYVDRRWPEDLP